MAGKTVARSSGRGLSPLFGRPFRSLRDEMDEMMNQLSLTPGSEWGNSALVPSVDLAETENALELKTDVPGLKPEEINVEFIGDRVRISGEQSALPILQSFFYM